MIEWTKRKDQKKEKKETLTDIKQSKKQSPAGQKRKKNSRFGNAVMRDEYTCWRFMERIAAVQVARLVAPKIARINIRARHCHSVNFPRCWLYRVRKEEGEGWRWYRRNRGWTEGKNTDIPTSRHPPPARWNFMRFALSMQRARGLQPHFRCITPLSLSHTSRELHPCTRVTSMPRQTTPPINQYTHARTQTNIYIYVRLYLWVHTGTRIEKKKRKKK